MKTEKKTPTVTVRAPSIEERLANLEKNFGQFVIDMVMEERRWTPPAPRVVFPGQTVRLVSDWLIALCYAAILTYFLMEIRRRYLQDNRGRRS